MKLSVVLSTINMRPKKNLAKFFSCKAKEKEKEVNHMPVLGKKMYSLMGKLQQTKLIEVLFQCNKTSP